MEEMRTDGNGGGMFLVAENLSFDCGNFRLESSFSCARGTMTCIVGPSGSGKSTLLRLIAGLERNSAKGAGDGKKTRIAIGGKDVTNLPPAKRGVGMVFQKSNLFPHMDVADNVSYGLRCMGIGRKEGRRRAEEFLESFNLSGFGKRMPETLSGGEAQRVALARTLIVHPELILFDEPLSALDAPLRKKLAAEIRALQKSLGFTGIMVTHDISEARTLADSIICIRNGTIIWQGPPKNFRETLLTE